VAAQTKFETQIREGLASARVMNPMILESLATLTDPSAFDVRIHDCYHLPPILLVSLQLLLIDSIPIFWTICPDLEETRTHRGAGEAPSHHQYLQDLMCPGHLFDAHCPQTWICLLFALVAGSSAAST